MGMHAFQDCGDGFCKCGLPQRNRHHAQPGSSILDRVAQQSASTSLTSSPNTSVLAAVQAMTHASSARAAVFKEIATFSDKHGVTDEELATRESLKWWPINTLRPRRIDLRHDGLLEPVLDEDGQEVRRATKGGSPATAWRLTAPARSALTGRPVGVSA